MDNVIRCAMLILDTYRTRPCSFSAVNLMALTAYTHTGLTATG